MSDSPDLTLPSKAPGMERYHHTPMELLPFALYTLVDFTDEELTQLQAVCESETDCDPGTKVKYPAQYKYVGGPLRAAFAYHLQLGREGEFDPTYFIAATSQDWREKGVLLVTLDDDDLECNVDSFQTRAETSGLSLVNLQVGNTDWFEEKENYELGNGDDDETPDEDSNDDSHSDESDGGNEATAGAIATLTAGVPTQPPPTGFFIGVYAHSETDGTALIRKIEPAAHLKTPEEFVCRLQSDTSFTNLSSDDTVTQACKTHPYRTQQFPHLHPNLFLVGSSQEDGILLIHLDWSGSTNGLSMEQLFDIGSTAPRKTRTIEASPTTTVPIFCDIACGRRKWISEHSMFGVYTVPYPDCDIKILELVDNQWSRRRRGEERVVVGQNIPESPRNIRIRGRKTGYDGVVVPVGGQGVGGESMLIPSSETFYAGVIRAHIALVYRCRFLGNFCKRYSIVAATTSPDVEGVLLFRIDWEGGFGEETGRQRNAHAQGDELVGRWREVVEVLQCENVGVAHEFLSEVVDGRRDWDGVRLGDFLG